jgi:hypothetical protein
MTAPALKPIKDADIQRTFFIDMADATDAVMRVLEAFALGGAHLTGLELKPVGEALRLRVVAVGLDEIHADRIRGRLAVMPKVRAVASGWRAV